MLLSTRSCRRKQQKARGRGCSSTERSKTQSHLVVAVAFPLIIAVLLHAAPVLRLLLLFLSLGELIQIGEEVFCERRHWREKKREARLERKRTEKNECLPLDSERKTPERRGAEREKK